MENVTGRFYALNINNCAFIPYMGKGIILNWQTKTFQQVNAAGALLLDALKAAAIKGKGVSSETLNAVLRAYFAEVQEEDVSVFLNKLMENQLVVEVENEAILPMPTFSWEKAPYQNPDFYQDLKIPGEIARAWPIWRWFKIPPEEELSG